MNPEISTRVFLVGCPRSGTTLLQSLLAANTHIASFPETHFYERLFGGRLRSALGIPSRLVKSHWNTVLEEIGHQEMGSILPKNSIFIRQYSKAFIKILDTITLNQGKFVWLEKTPGHLRRVDEIEHLVNHPLFIHILRNGEDNIASLFGMGIKFKQQWSHYYGTLDQCIQRWVTDAYISKNYNSSSNHRLVKYEHLINNPKPVLEELCEYIGVPFENEMILNYASVADGLILGRESWKTTVRGPITSGNRRYYEILNDEQRQYILSQIPEDLLSYFHMEGQN